MDTSGIVLIFIGGLLLGYIIGNFLRGLQEHETKERKRENVQFILQAINHNFGKLSQETLKEANSQFLTLAEQRFKDQAQLHSTQLEGKKELIDQSLNNMTKNLGDVTQLVKEFELSREQKLGALGNELRQLTHTSSLIQRALADNRSRGQWGERIAEDILRIAGFVEGVNYSKQITLEIDSKKKSRPDFTFIFPNGMTLNMDSKFPLDNYMKYLEAQADVDKLNHKKAFLKDVQSRLKEVVDRGYIGGEQPTLDCMVVFIPNEQIYRFIYEEDAGIIDVALQNRIILCSPLTLYVVLSVVRQAVDNFKLQQASKDILVLLSEFKKHWKEYNDDMLKLEKALGTAQATYDDLIGKRKRALDRPLQRVDSLLEEKGINSLATHPEI